MSELYSVTVEKVEGPRVDMRITTVHPDAGPPPKAATFPVNLLVDLWSFYDRAFQGLLHGIESLEDDDAKAWAAREPWGPVMRELCNLAHGVDLPVTKQEYDALEAQGTEALPARLKGKRVGSWWSQGNEFFVNVTATEEQFAAAATPLVASYRQEQMENQESYAHWPEWPDDPTDESRAAYIAKQPRALLVVTMKDAGILGFVRPGVSFDTAAYF